MGQGTKTERVLGRGTGDEIGKARFLPSQKRQRVANGEWRIVFSGGQRSCAAEKFSAHQEMRPPVFQPASAGFVFVAPSSVAWMRWEGEAPAEPKTAANGDWQLATGKTAASSEW